MGLILFVLLLVVPVAELWIILQVADQIGGIWTVLLLIAISIAGAWLLKQQGVATWRRMRETLRKGQMPAGEVADGALILLGGALLLTPGFLTDFVGLTLLFPPTRAMVKAAVMGSVARRAQARLGFPADRRPRVQEARVVNVERTERPKSPTDPSAGRLPSSGYRDDEDGSPDTR
ncbi:MAG: FxsA family protein [Actinomycetota bacterium]|nr:FxsA family protein [Actinomycetota bacterium]